MLIEFLLRFVVLLFLLLLFSSLGRYLSSYRPSNFHLSVAVVVVDAIVDVVVVDKALVKDAVVKFVDAGFSASISTSTTSPYISVAEEFRLSRLKAHGSGLRKCSSFC